MSRQKNKFIVSLDLKAFEADMGLSYRELMDKYKLNYMQVYKALKVIWDDMSKRVVPPAPLQGSQSLCRIIKDMMPDIELLHREGTISDWQYNQYQTQAASR